MSAVDARTPWRSVGLVLALGAMLDGCANELSLSGGAGAQTGDVVSVRTRPVCGNAQVEPGEACDDGANGDDADGCDDRCQAPCGADALEVLRCVPGRTTVQSYDDVDVSTGRPIHWTETIDTTLCDLRGGGSIEVLTCRDGVCLNIIPPMAGERVCSAPCGEGSPCGPGFTCSPTFVPGSDPLENAEARCLPAIGGALGDECGMCGEGLGCGTTAGAETYFVCAQRVDTCDGAKCGANTICGAAEDVHTHAPNGSLCFAVADFCPGGPLDTSNLNEVCTGGCNALAACNLYYPDPENPDQHLDCEAYCREFGGDFALTMACGERNGCDGFSVPVKVDHFESAPSRSFPSPVCDADVDAACTFGADCDPDCHRATGCGDIPAAGHCNDRGVLYCDQNRVMSINCAVRGLHCGYDADQARFDCIGGAQ